MSEPMSCCVVAGSYCARVDALLNLPGVHVIDVAWRPLGGRQPDRLVLMVETAAGPAGCPGCGALANGHGRRLRRLHDIPAFGAPVELVRRARRFRCAERLCAVEGFTEVHDLAGPRAKLTSRAARWAIGCVQSDTASVAAVAGGLGWTGIPCGTRSSRC